jgi:putative ABC transport system permease protein
MTGIGGILGMLLGRFFPDAISWIAYYFFKYNIPTKVNYWSFPVAAGFSIVVGIVFGLYPARRAALMDPIEALRHE